MSIAPTIGRVVLYFPSVADIEGGMIQHSDAPMEAHVVYVWSDTCVNLVGFDHDGHAFKRYSVAINDTDGKSPHAEWMPYQIGQAAKQAAETAPA